MDKQQLQHTCLTCSVMFEDAELQRNHYKSDWHRYNLKRKVAEMAPVTLESFQQRMNNHEAQMKVISGEIKEPTGYCVACRKSFSTQKAYKNHLNSKKHKDENDKFEKRENKVVITHNRINRKISESVNETEDDEMEYEELDSDEWEDLGEDEEVAAPNPGQESIPITTCLFCPNKSKDHEKNLLHMMEKHSFFIPDIEYVIDIEGLLAYLGEKVGLGYICLACDYHSKHFQSLESVQRHMIDKGHCRLRTEGDSFLDYSRFYDYTSSYPTAVVGVGEDEEDVEVQVNRLDDTGYELTLPSGVKIGHRSLMKYYRQNLVPDREVQIRRPTGRFLNQYKALGWAGSSGVDAKKKARDVLFMNRLKQKHNMKLGVKTNKLQRHFVDPNM